MFSNWLIHLGNYRCVVGCSHRFTEDAFKGKSQQMLNILQMTTEEFFINSCRLRVMGLYVTLLGNIFIFKESRIGMKMVLEALFGFIVLYFFLGGL